MFGIERMDNFAARHPIQIRAANGFPVAGHFDVDRGNAPHWNHH
jgi:hypothetical protein